MMNKVEDKRVDPNICAYCGAHFSPGLPPEKCPLCEDLRGLGFKPPRGHRFLTLTEFQCDFELDIREEEPGLHGIGVRPEFAAGHRALLVETRGGNILWDCTTLINEKGVDFVESRGGLAGIAASHPHFYGAMVEWSHAFRDVPVYVHELDRQWITNPDSSIVYWSDPVQPLPGGITLVHIGGHFAGAAVLHWPNGAENRGVLLTGDPMSVTPDRHVTFMYAYPNMVPLNRVAIEQIARSIEPFEFDRIHGGWFGRKIPRLAKDVVARSVDRYLAAIT